jgi:hypothetical protein
MGICPKLPASAARLVIKSSMRTIIVLFVDRFPEVVGAVWILGLIDLL